MNFEHKYDDIINLEHPTSKKHPRMSLENRSAQFAPFSALEGYEDAVSEEARITENKISLSEDEKEQISESLEVILKNPFQKIIITYFEKDKKKQGGCYKTLIGIIKGIDHYNGILKMKSGEIIKIEDLKKIQLVWYNVKRNWKVKNCGKFNIRTINI